MTSDGEQSNLEMPEQGPPDPNIEMALSVLNVAEAAPPDSLVDIYTKNREATAIQHVEIKTGKDSANVLYLSELLIGHQDSAVDFFINTINQVKDLPEAMKPDAVVMSGMLQGDFKMLEKRRRSTLVPELNSMDAQFRYAKQLIDQVAELDVPIVYNMSNDDRRIAEEYTIEVFRKMIGYANKHVPYWRIDQMRQHPKWVEHFQFQTNTVFPYCLRSGRRLRSAEEMGEVTDGEVAVEEYFMLYDTCKKIEAGVEPNPEYERWLDMASLHDQENFVITDDVNLEIETKGKKYTDYVRHSLGFSPQPMYGNHMKTAAELVGQMASNGQPTPDMLVTQHNQEEVGVGNQNAWIVSTGGLIRARNFINSRGSKTDVAGDVSRRLATTRRRIPSPSATMHERTDDDRHIVTYFNEVLNEKAYSLPERMTIAELCDLQTGSITARPDILAKYLDYIRVRALGERATALFFGGDMVHGRNYSNFASESQSTGLMSMDAQVRFNETLFKASLAGMTPEEVAAITRVVVQKGNHEWNSGTDKWHGYSFTDYMRSTFEKEFLKKGYSDEEIDQKITQHEAVMTPKGEVAQANTSTDYFGDYGVLIQHYLLERGGKGSGGDMPVYQSHNYATGAGELMAKLDILMQGHWHHPQYGLFGDKIGVVGGSMAGLSGYELWRGYRPTIAGTLIHLGGGLPVQIEFVSEQTLHGHKITTGQLSDKNLQAEGYHDDENFDPIKHGLLLPRNFPKSGLQKAIRHMMQDVSERKGRIAELR